MTQEQWDEVERLYHELSTQPSSGWGTLLEQACPDDESVRREVRRLLEQTVSGTGLLNDSPPIHRGFLVSPAPDLAGHRIGAFTILQRIGAGGMGEVYRARDNRLQRDVAIKILPPVFTADVDRRARFEREARLLASLNHPNIAAIYGFEETEGIRGLVLELVEGPTLADRLENGPLPCAEALPIARQIADALAAAHEQGVIHRDVKPANIKVRSDGTVKVLDFGLAKNVTGNLPDESEVATAEYFSTNQGQIIGTAPYMSPEQARGAAVDRRADVWAFGCVLYEMLTGKRAFPGQHVTDILAAVLRGEPDWNALPADTPTSIRRLLRRSLLKDPQDRLADMSVAQLEIDDAVGEERASERPVKPSAARTNNRNGVLAAVGILILLASISLWFLLKGTDAPPPHQSATTITLPSNTSIPTRQGVPFATSNDGSRFAFIASSEGRIRLYVRDLGNPVPKLLEDTDGARLPFFSPGGQWIGYYAKGKLMRVSISGGKPIPIRPITLPHGVAWGPDETIIFQADGLLQRVPVTGGKPEPIESNDPQKDKVAWVHQLLPGGKHLLASIGASFGILDLSAKQWKVLGKGARAQYIDPGYVLFHAPAVGQGELQVASLNLETMQLGPPGHAWSDVFRATNNGPAFFAASFNGTVVFAREGLNRTLVQVDRNGRRTPLIAERAGYRLPRFSSDRRYLAVTVDPRPPKFRVFDLERGSNVTLSKEGGYGFGAAWNGNQVAYTDDDGIYVGPADGSLPPEKWGGNNSWFPRFWISNRELLAYTVPGRIGIIRRGELPQVLFEGGRRPGISADRHWIAYDVAEGDREEVYVRSFPDLKQTIRMTYDGCHSPMFSPSPDGREVFCMDGNALFTVPYQVQNGKFSPDKRKFLFDGPFETSNFLGYDTTDGKTFVMVLADPEANPDRLEIVQNWSPEAKRGN